MIPKSDSGLRMMATSTIAPVSAISLAFDCRPKASVLFPLGHDRTEIDRLAEFLIEPARRPRQEVARRQQERHRRNPGNDQPDQSHHERAAGQRQVQDPLRPRRNLERPDRLGSSASSESIVPRSAASASNSSKLRSA